MSPEMRKRLRGMVGTEMPNDKGVTVRQHFVIEPEVDWREVMQEAEAYIVWLEYVYGIKP